MVVGSSDTLYQTFRRRLLADRLVSPEDRVLVALSGGADSVALLDLLGRVAPELELELRVGSVDHGLRGPRGRSDLQFAANLAREMGLVFHGESADAGRLAREEGLSIEEAARRVRYEVLGRVACEWGEGPSGPVRVALGHTRDDQAETVLMRIVEGTGLDGLGGMSPLQPRAGWVLIRPLLSVSRGAIREYCLERGLPWREDETNDDLRFRRNFLRAQVMPLLRDCNPNVVDALAALADEAREDALALALAAGRQAEGLVAKGIPAGESPFSALAIDSETVRHIALSSFADLHPALRRCIIRDLVTEEAGPEILRELGRDGVERSLDLAANPRVGARLDLPRGLLVETGYRHLFLARRVSGAARSPNGTTEPAGGETPAGDSRIDVELNLPGRTEVPGLGWTFVTSFSPGGGATGRFCHELDLRRLSRPLRVRTRRPGDRFSPAGLGGSKKLKDFFISAKVPRAERDRWPLIVDARDRIVWVVGLRADERFLAGEGEPGTGERLFIRAEPWRKGAGEAADSG